MKFEAVLLCSLCVAACTQERTPQNGVDTTLPDILSSISGTVSFPGDFSAGPIQVCAETANGGKQVACQEKPAGETYVLPLAPGNYYVFARAAEMGSTKAYYTQAVVCGLYTFCEDHTPISVTVKEGDELKNIDPGDWYASSSASDQSMDMNISDGSESSEEGSATETTNSQPTDMSADASPTDENSEGD